MTNRNPSKQSRAKENRKKRDDLKARAKRAERKRLGLEDDEDEALLAGPIRRYFAFALDLVLIIFTWLFCMLVEVIIAPTSGFTDKLYPLAVTIFGVLYLIPKLKIEGSTFGRKKMKIEVTRADGNGFLTWTQAITRWSIEYGICFVLAPIFAIIFKQYEFTITLASFALFGIIMLPALFTERKQAIHDILAGSVTVRVFPDKRKFFKK